MRITRKGNIFGVKVKVADAYMALIMMQDSFNQTTESRIDSPMADPKGLLLIRVVVMYHPRIIHNFKMDIMV